MRAKFKAGVKTNKQKSLIQPFYDFKLNYPPTVLLEVTVSYFLQGIG